MRVAVTGATGFVGRQIVKLLASQGHVCRAWYRPESDRGGFEETPAEMLEWVPGELANPLAAQQLVAGCDAVVHAALHHEEGDLANADYWYRRAGRQRPAAAGRQEYEAMARQLLDG